MHLQDSQEAGGFREPIMGKQKELLDHCHKKFHFPLFSDTWFGASKDTKEGGQGLYGIQVRVKSNTLFRKYTNKNRFSSLWPCEQNFQNLERRICSMSNVCVCVHKYL